MTKKKGEFHPVASIFPLMDEQELKTLAEDIKARGQCEPIVRCDGKILDGRNRWRACKIAKIKCREKKLKVSDPVAYVLSQNLHRRHLNTSQRAMIAAEVAKLEKGRPEKNTQISVFSQSQAAEALGVSTGAVQQAKQVKTKGSKKLRRAVESGEVAVSKAAAVLDKPKPKQLAAAKKKKAGSPKDSPKQKARAILDRLEAEAGRHAPRLDDVSKLLGDKGHSHRACLKALDAYLGALKERKRQTR